jgi:hypothetical protein
MHQWLAKKQATTCAHREARPNPSLERTSTGKAAWPRGAEVHFAPRGQGALPVASAQLKR